MLCMYICNEVIIQQSLSQGLNAGDIITVVVNSVPSKAMLHNWLSRLVKMSKMGVFPPNKLPNSVKDYDFGARTSHSFINCIELSHAQKPGGNSDM